MGVVGVGGWSLHDEAISFSIRNNWLELAAMVIFVVGCICDHLTTAYGLMLPNIHELNMNVLFLMGHGLWHIAEILIIMAGVGSGYLALKSESNLVVNLSTFMLMSGGLFRFYASIQNLTIILNVIT